MAVLSTLRGVPTARLSEAFRHYYARLISRLDQLPRKGPLSSRTTRLIATIAFSLAIVTSGYGGYRTYKRRKAERETGKRLVRRNSGLRGKDGSRTIFVPYKDSTSRVIIFPTRLTTFDAHRRLFLSSTGLAGEKYDPATGPPPTNIKPGLNIAFLHQFLSLMSIMVPRWRSKESGLLATHAVFLLARTYLSLVVARLDGEIVRDLVAGKGKAFLLGICKWLAIGSVSSYTNSMIKFLQSKISIAFRTRLTRYIHDLYLSPDLAYYKLHNLDGGIGQGAVHLRVHPRDEGRVGATRCKQALPGHQVEIGAPYLLGHGGNVRQRRDAVSGGDGQSTHASRPDVLDHRRQGQEQGVEVPGQ